MALIPASVPDEVAVYCADMFSAGFMGAENGNIPMGVQSPSSRRVLWG